MDRAAYLKDQVSRAERLARSVTDKLTTERLMAFAADCRTELKALLSSEPQNHFELIDHEPGSSGKGFKERAVFRLT